MVRIVLDTLFCWSLAALDAEKDHDENPGHCRFRLHMCHSKFGSKSHRSELFQLCGLP